MAGTTVEAGLDPQTKPRAHDAATLRRAIETRTAVVGVVGLGYVGLPLAVATAGAGFTTVGLDTDPAKARAVRSGRSYVDRVPGPVLGELVAGRRLSATGDLQRLAACDVIVICVPTPLTPHREPDLSFVEATAQAVRRTLRPGQLIVLESTSYPGTTREVVKPILEASGYASGADFFLAFSPEREDPGNVAYGTRSIPKVVAGDGSEAAELAHAFYAAFVDQVVPVSSVDVAEAVKITENIFRAVNIALVNELKVIFAAMKIDIWEVIEAAKTKPFGYMAFDPGPGLGGHCIPVDPFYLTWKSREFELPTRFIELAGEINLAMPRYVTDVLVRALNARGGPPLSRSRILVMGLAYKRNVADVRQSPALKIIDLLEAGGACVDYHDPHVPEIPSTRDWGRLAGRRSVPAPAGAVIAAYDAVVITTDHDAVDYRQLDQHAQLIIDTRNVMARRGLQRAAVVKA